MLLELNARQEATLRMTSELRQAIEILQYSTYEIEQFVQEQAIENPLIELGEQESSFIEEASFTPLKKQRFIDIPSNFSQQAQEPQTRDELFKQAKLLYSDKAVRKLLKYLIYNLNDSGYLNLAQNNFQLTEPEIEKGILLLQNIGPPGIGARNLKECLLLQINYADSGNSEAAELVEKHLPLLAKHQWNKIASLMNISMTEVKNLYDFILTLNPRPCSFSTHASTEYVIPDIIVENKNGMLRFRLTTDQLPTIRVSSAYANLSYTKDETAKYLQTQHKKIQWLLTSLEQRRNTMIKITEVLLQKQYRFFQQGLLAAEPLTLKEVAEAAGLHESTVSRAVANKIIQTSFGAFELRSLFTSKLNTSEGSTVSQTKVKNLLQQLISEENKQKPYSDQQLADCLSSKHGVSISRRTVTKYREALDLPSSSRRKMIYV